MRGVFPRVHPARRSGLFRGRFAAATRTHPNLRSLRAGEHRAQKDVAAVGTLEGEDRHRRVRDASARAAGRVSRDASARRRSLGRDELFGLEFLADFLRAQHERVQFGLRDVALQHDEAAVGRDAQLLGRNELQ